MRKIDFDVLLEIFERNITNIDKLAKRLFKTEKQIESALFFLEKEGYIFKNEITNKGKNKLATHKVDNAIILAAGMSTRFVPLNYEKPKGLLLVKGESLVERQIKALREKGIEEIIIVVGYMKEQFKYLIEKYGVTLVETEEYKSRNNHSSIYAARKYLKNSIITSSDLYFTENLFQTYAYDSYYSSIYISGKTAERGIKTDEDDKILKTFYGNKCYDVWVTLGYAFFSRKFSKKIIEIIEAEYNKPESIDKFWADFQDDYLEELYMYAKKCEDNIIYEFDSLEELRDFDVLYKNNSGSKIMKDISDFLNIKESEIVELTSLKNIKYSMFKFKCKRQLYICDVVPDEREEVNYLGKKYTQVLEKENILKIFKIK
ncbi:MAG: NTP transferase domain-containing protein [Fusobacterium sp.]|nr:NTP transferase domain-containing protein [Fusobacterium sp.]